MAYITLAVILVSFLAANGSADEVAFDCFRESSLSTTGVIPFDGCDVDSTTLDPMKGSFTVTEPGLWRFTFTGVVQVGTGQGVVGLFVNDVPKASTEIAPGINAVVGLYQISLNNLVELETGDNVELRWTGTENAVLYSQAIGVHWTGMMYSASGAFTPSSSFYILFICALSSIGTIFSH